MPKADSSRSSSSDSLRKHIYENQKRLDCLTQELQALDSKMDFLVQALSAVAKSGESGEVGGSRPEIESNQFQDGHPGASPHR